MDIRKMGFALALPLALGIAGCRSTQTARAEGTAPAPAGTGATVEGSPGAKGGDAEGGAVATTPGRTAPSDTTYGTSGTAPDDGTLTGERGAMTGSDIKGHASDQVLVGTVASVSSGSLSITPDLGGAARTLLIVPETLITVEGRDGRAGDIKEGEQIRASFNEQQGRQVAVKIEAGTSGTGDTSGTSR